MRLKCIDDHKEGLKDPDVTKNHFYDSIDNNVHVLNHEPMFTVLGDNREEVTRPKHIFQTMPEMHRYKRIQESINKRINKTN